MPISSIMAIALEPSPFNLSRVAVAFTASSSGVLGVPRMLSVLGGTLSEPPFDARCLHKELTLKVPPNESSPDDAMPFAMAFMCSVRSGVSDVAAIAVAAIVAAV